MIKSYFDALVSALGPVPYPCQSRSIHVNILNSLSSAFNLSDSLISDSSFTLNKSNTLSYSVHFYITLHFHLVYILNTFGELTVQEVFCVADRIWISRPAWGSRLVVWSSWDTCFCVRKCKFNLWRCHFFCVWKHLPHSLSHTVNSPPEPLIAHRSQISRVPDHIGLILFHVIIFFCWSAT